MYVKIACDQYLSAGNILLRLLLSVLLEIKFLCVTRTELLEKIRTFL